MGDEQPTTRGFRGLVNAWKGHADPDVVQVTFVRWTFLFTVVLLFLFIGVVAWGVVASQQRLERELAERDLVLEGIEEAVSRIDDTRTAEFTFLRCVLLIEPPERTEELVDECEAEAKVSLGDARVEPSGNAVEGGGGPDGARSPGRRPEGRSPPDEPQPRPRPPTPSPRPPPPPPQPTPRPTPEPTPSPTPEPLIPRLPCPLVDEVCVP